MKNAIAALWVGIFFLTLGSWSGAATDAIAPGEQPQIGIDTKAVIRVVYGLQDKIFCSTSGDQGISFSKPVLVAQLPGMHLGMSRGPQLASSAGYSIISAIDKSGDIHWFRLSHESGEWKAMGMINDLKGSGPEGLMSIAADKNDHFYAVWLDTRTGGHNQVYFSSLDGNAQHWSKNVLVYRSPFGHVCECCKPNIAVEGSGVAIMFRNWINGSRDLYLLKSSDKGKTFGEARKLGMGTWKLNGCPMDGGGITIDRSYTVHSVWQREGTVFACKPGEMETRVGRGRICSMAGNADMPWNAAAPGNADNVVINMQTGDTVKLVRLSQKEEIPIGTGGFLRSIVLPGNKILCVWEQDKVIKFRKV